LRVSAILARMWPLKCDHTVPAAAASMRNRQALNHSMAANRGGRPETDPKVRRSSHLRTASAPLFAET